MLTNWFIRQPVWKRRQLAGLALVVLFSVALCALVILFL